ncbi:hypothetical protein RRG08_020472 [Elysia crispata]|uniref:Uncharacterized protein n=1 Tax=Elysia crispata TaxID=231223 RepID=A0AAE1ABZ1_9GAST|nr:hypothetical protein RRG08_020472 [Elysia crispata]
MYCCEPVNIPVQETIIAAAEDSHSKAERPLIPEIPGLLELAVPGCGCWRQLSAGCHWLTNSPLPNSRAPDGVLLINSLDGKRRTRGKSQVEFRGMNPG